MASPRHDQLSGADVVASYLLRQSEERESLAATFDEDFKDYNAEPGKICWNVPQPTHVSLRLSPHLSEHDAKVYAQIKLNVRCQRNYPAVVPELELVEEQGLSKQLVKELQAEVKSLAARKVGEVMIYDLAQCVQDFLSRHNKPPAPSFHDQMMFNQKKKDQKRIEEERMRAEEERKREEQKNRDVEHEISIIYKKVKEERRGRTSLIFPLDEEMREEPETRSPARPSVRFDEEDKEEPAIPLRRRKSSESKAKRDGRGVKVGEVVFEAKTVVTATETQAKGKDSKKPKSEKDAQSPKPISKASSPVPIATDHAENAAAKNKGPKTPDSASRRNRLPSSCNSDTSEETLGRQKTPSVDSIGLPSPSSSPIVSSSSSCDDCRRETTYLTFVYRGEQRSVLRGRCLGHGPRGSVAFVGMDKSTGEVVVVKEWRAPLLSSGEKVNKKKLSPNISKAANEAFTRHSKTLAGAENEMTSLTKLHHDQIVAFRGMKVAQEQTELVVQVLEDYSPGTNCQQFLANANAVDIPTLRKITQGILSALDYLHERNIAHKDLRPSSVFVNGLDGIRLGDFSIDKRIYEIIRAVTNSPPVDALPLPMGRSSKKADVYRLGLLLLSLARGFVVKEMIPDVSSPELTQRLPLLFCDFLLRCLDQDERARWTVTQLLDHDFLKLKVEEKLPDETKEEQKPPDPAEEEEEKDDVPVVTSCDSSGQSRLANEFEVLRWIGKGGFGDVIKVRNKLDAGLYAIKRIPLDPKSRQLTRKITREVKLLSRLNHENVVRYYNSWIETCLDEMDSDASVTTASATPSTNTTSPEQRRLRQLKENEKPKENSLGLKDDVEGLAPPPADSDSWNVDAENEDDEDDDDDEMDVFGFSFGSFGILSDSEEDNIVFDDPNRARTPSGSGIEPPKRVLSPEEAAITLRLQYLYIQMEYCEKSTLRSLIDDGELYKDVPRVWKLFREIVEGLAYIHEQGLIHRDLKPVNVFLTSDDHVKIGDFGLATTSITRAFQTPTIHSKGNEHEVSFTSEPTESSVMTTDESLTGKVGTALYVAPELTSGGKLTYSQKVDMYSLGISFFEMCYRPLKTGMERIKIISELRMPAIKFPEPSADFDLVARKSQVRVIRWLLTHEVSTRPSADELLSSELLPRPPLEEAQFSQTLNRALSQTGSANYRKLMSCLFDRSVSMAQDQCWELDAPQSQKSFSRDGGFNVSLLSREESVVEARLSAIFAKHGAVRMRTPLLLPKSMPVVDARVVTFDQAVQLLDPHGSVSLLPYNLRISFARFLARHPVSNIKRFAIERVFQARRIAHVHPRELVECAFDVVTPSLGNLVPDAEVLHVAQEIVNAFPAINARNYVVTLNHPQLIKGVLLHYGVPEEKFPLVFNVLVDSRTYFWSKIKVNLELDKLSIAESTIDDLTAALFENIGPLNRVAAHLKPVTKSKGLASSMVRTGLHEIETLIANCQSFGIQLPLVVDPAMVRSIQHFSSVFFSISPSIPSRPRRNASKARSLLALGGRYDRLVNVFRRPGSVAASLSEPAVEGSKSQFVTGISFAYALLTNFVREEQGFAAPATRDVHIAAVGHRFNMKEALTLADRLWSLDVSVDLATEPATSLEDLHGYCRDEKVACLVLLRGDGSEDPARLHLLDSGGRFTEKRVSVNEIPDVVSLYLKENEEIRVGEPGGGSGSSGGAGGDPSTPVGTSMGSFSKFFDLDIKFRLEEKISPADKKRQEMKIHSKISSSLAPHFRSGAPLPVLVTELPGAVIRTIAAFVDLSVDDEDKRSQLLQTIVEKHQRFRKYVADIVHVLFDLKTSTSTKSANNLRPVVLYSIKDENFRLLL